MNVWFFPPFGHIAGVEGYIWFAVKRALYMHMVGMVPPPPPLLPETPDPLKQKSVSAFPATATKQH